jgi:putative endonuclease
MTDRTERQAARSRGLAAEDAISNELCADGWRVVARNWRGGGGELDIVVRRDTVLRFVEVKHRADGSREVISSAQVRRLRSAARAWMVAQRTEWWSEACFWLAVSTDDDVTQWQLDPF